MAETLLVTTTLACWLLDVASGEAWQFHRGQGVYYGITFDCDTLYVAARNTAYGADRLAQDNLILCFDHALTLQRTLRAPQPIRDVHQIVVHDGTLHIVSTFDDCIVLYETGTGRWDRWFPFGEGGEPNQHHINSIHVDGSQILLAGNKPEGWYARFDPRRRPLGAGRVPLGRGTHNVWPEPDGSVAVCSSVEGCIVSDRVAQRAVHPRAWLRGIARSGDQTFLGISQNRVRDMRGPSDCSVVRVDAEGRIDRCWSFHQFGMVHDMRTLGVADATHNGVVFTVGRDALAPFETVQTASELVDLGADRQGGPGPPWRTGRPSFPEHAMQADTFRRVYFYHLKKCGGTSLDHWLSRQVSDDRTNDTDWLKPLVGAFLDQPEPSAEGERLERTVGRSVFHWTDALTSHMPLRRWAPPDTLCVTVLRDPVDRLVSQVADWRRLSVADYPDIPRNIATMIRDASVLPLRTFLETHGRGTLLLDNYLVRALAAVRLGFAVKTVADTADLFGDALDSLTNAFDVVGLTERLLVSLNAVAERLGRVPEDLPPALNETRSKTRLSDEVTDAQEILTELTVQDRQLYEQAERLFAERHAVQGASYNRAVFERRYAAAAVERLTGVKQGDATVYSVRAPIIGSGFHGRDAARSENCRVWSGPSSRSVLYLPVPAGATLALKLWVHGYADDDQRTRLAVSVDGVRTAHRFIAQDGYRDVIETVARPVRSFAALEIDVGATHAGREGTPGHDPRRRGLSFDRYGWTVLSEPA